MTIHPYIPNSVPEIKREMLRQIGVKDLDELIVALPKEIRYTKKLELPPPTSEYEVRRHVESVLSRNKSTKELTSFLGAGCWPHYVPAVCDEINSRSEYLTAYTGNEYSDLGRFQALFEFQSMLGDLVEMDVVTFPVYDWATACGDAARMAVLSTGRREILVPKTISPNRLSVMRAYCGGLATIQSVDYDIETGQLDLEDLKRKTSSKTAGIYIENPTYLGFIENNGEEISEIAHNHGALSIVGVNPLSLGVLTPPGEYGADIVCGEGQPFGMHMYCGGALLGFLACLDEERLISAIGHRLVTITTTERKGEWGFTYVLPERTMFAVREKSATFMGTSTVLWAITSAVYLSLLGPQGLGELGEVIMKRSHFAMKQLAEVKGLKAPLFTASHFDEFTVNFDETGKSAREIHNALLKFGVQGGKCIAQEFPELKNTALYCVTEIHTQEDIDKLVNALKEIVR